MSDRYDEGTRAVVDAAVEEARRFGHRWVGTEHLLLALAARSGTLPSAVAGLLPAAGAIRAKLTAVAGPVGRDADLLRTVGIDLDRVRAAARETFGGPAIEAAQRRRPHQTWQPWRRGPRRCGPLVAERLSFAPRAEQALAQAARDADRRRNRLIDPAAVLTGIIAVEGSMASRLLHSHGIRPHTIRMALESPVG